MKDLKERAIRGGVARLCAQGATFAIRLGSLMILARLLSPKDFGLVGMVTAFTGVLDLFRDFGLSAATIQKSNVTDEQVSTLFWINAAVGVALALIMAAVSPWIATFYNEPRLRLVTIVLSTGLIFNSLGVQHSAVLQREMRFTALAVIGVIAFVLSASVSIGAARAGWGYWSLVAMTVSLPLITTVGLWICARWVPQWPKRRAGIHSMVRFGGALTLNGLTVYVASNFEKILLGRFWGVDAIGLYGRAFQLINLPTSNLNSIAGEIAFSTLSRLQDDPARRRNCFLKGFSLVLALTLPLTVACGLFAKDLITVLLGAQWAAAVPIFRWLAPTIIVFAVANPFSWLLTASGHIRRLMKMSLVIAPIMIVAYIVALPHGPQGVAFAYSTVMVLWLVPLTIWALHGTEVSVSDVIRSASVPSISSLLAGGLAFGASVLLNPSWRPLVHLIFECGIFGVSFIVILMSVAEQRSMYGNLLHGLIRDKSISKPSSVSA